MSNVVHLVINDRPQYLTVKEYRGQRVVTFREIDDLHQRAEGTAARNFRQNRQRFSSGKHYFEVDQPDEIRRLGLERPQGGVPERVTLVTESGYLLLVKSLTDGLAWEVQEKLIDGYFRAKEFVSPVYQIPQTYAEALRLAADLSEKVETQKQTIALMEPKAEFHDAVAVAENCQEVGEVARVLNTGRNRLFKWMREQKILIPGTRLPYQSFIDEGYFRVIEQTWESNGGDTNITTKTLVTGKGLLWLQKRYKQGA